MNKQENMNHNWEQDFRDFYYETGKYLGRKRGIDGYLDFIRQEKELSAREAEERVLMQIWYLLDATTDPTMKITKFVSERLNVDITSNQEKV